MERHIDFPKVLTLWNILNHERKQGERVYLGLVGGIMMAGFIRFIGKDMVVLELGDPDGQGGFVDEGRFVTVAISHLLTVERVGG